MAKSYSGVILRRLHCVASLLFTLSNATAAVSIEKTSIIGSKLDYPPFATGSSDDKTGGFIIPNRDLVDDDAKSLVKLNQELALTKVSEVHDMSEKQWFGIFNETKTSGKELLIYMATVAAGLLSLVAFIFFNRQKERSRIQTLLQRSEERFKLAIENTQAGLWDWNVETGELITSPEWSTMLGYEPGCLTHISEYEALFHPVDLPEAQRRLQTHFDGKAPFYEIEHRLRHKDGHWIWVLGKGKVVNRDKDDQPLRMIGTNVEITARIITEEKLRLTQFAVDNASDEVYQADKEGRIIYANQQACRNLGYAQDELIGLSIQDINPDISEERWGEFWKNLPNKKVMFSETIHRRKDGSLYPVEVSANYTKYSGKDYSIAFIRDITIRKEAEEELKLYQLMIEKSSDPFFIIDDDSFRMIYVNDAAVKHFGAPREEILTWRIPDWDPDFSYKVQSKQVGEVKKLKSLFFESVHRVKSGELVPVEISINLIQYKGRSCHFGYFKNITERKEAENALRLSKELAEKSARFKSQFLADMSHEIRTPMNGVIGLTELALGQEMSSDLRDYLNKILTSSQSLLGILNDILDLSKIEAGGLTIVPASFDFDTVIDTLRHLFEQQAQRKGLAFHIDISGNTPLELIGDSLRLQQVLSNLLSNAVKFTESGHVELKISVLRRLKNQVILSFSVQDTGIGLSQSDISKLFVPFGQADDSISRRFGGTGLGLAISRNLISLMGGTLKVDSVLGRGAVFSFELTLEVAGERIERLIRHEFFDADRRHSNQQFHTVNNLIGLHLLVAEDNLVNQFVAHGLLERSGFVVTLASNGKEALELLERQKFDAVLMDMQMPVMDGLEAVRSIRKQKKFADLPVIALTAGVTQEDRNRCFAAGMNDFACKPINTPELIETLSKWIKQK